MMPIVRMGDSMSPFGGEVLEGHYEALDGHRCECGCRLVRSLAASSMVVGP